MVASPTDPDPDLGGFKTYGSGLGTFGKSKLNRAGSSGTLSLDVCRYDVIGTDVDYKFVIVADYYFVFLLSTGETRSGVKEEEKDKPTTEMSTPYGYPVSLREIPYNKLTFHFSTG